MDSGKKAEKILSKTLTGDYKLPTWAAVLILIAGLIILGGYYVFKEYKAYQDKQAEILLVQQEELALARQEIEALKNGGGLKKAEEIIKAEPTSPLAAVVKEWRPRVASIECLWDGLFGEETSNGSGLWLSNISTAITSDHVVVKEGVRLGPPAKADSCSVKLPGGEAVTIKTEDISGWRGLPAGRQGIEGVAAITIKNPPVSMKQIASSLNLACKNQVATGERIIVLGYPSIGTKGDVTVTEGIISGYEDDFYIVSAKIEKGMSGGVAVFVDRNCYLGIPIFVRAGEVESLGRILDARLLLK